MSEFKKGDPVMYTQKLNEFIPYGTEGVVVEVHLGGHAATVNWFGIGDQISTLTSSMKLITDEKPENHFADFAKKVDLQQFNPAKEAVTVNLANQMFSPIPVPMSDGAPQPNTLEWWRWHYAGESMKSQRLIQVKANHEILAIESVRDADALIAELQKKGGES